MATTSSILSAWAPWLILMRKASAPARNSLRIISGVLLAGPRVARTRTLRLRGAICVDTGVLSGFWLWGFWPAAMLVREFA